MILKHRDRELLRFEWIGPQGVHVVSVNESERKLLPLEMTGAADDDALQDLLDRLRHIKDFLQKRVSEILEFGDKADEFLKISRERDSVNHANNVSCALQIKENES